MAWLKLSAVLGFPLVVEVVEVVDVVVEGVVVVAEALGEGDAIPVEPVLVVLRSTAAF
jgi:hypothetical protein